MNNDIKYQVIKDIFLKTKVFNKSALDFRILVFNEKIKRLLTGYKTIDEWVINLDKTIELISLYLGVSEIEKKKMGEVFTPFKLIDEMLDTLPDYVWTNPYLKWLDPANGIGNFPIRVIQRLYESLRNYKDDKLDLTDDIIRYKYILKEMIYMCDIQPKNNYFTTMLLGGFNGEKYDINLYTHSFLDEDFDIHMKDVWGLDGFDIVMGNPPYNYNKDNTIYEKFTIKSFSLLGDNKYLLFLTKKAIFSKFIDNKILKNYNVDLIKLDVDYDGLDLSVAYFLASNRKRINMNVTDSILNKVLDGKKTYYPSKSTINVDLNNRENSKGQYKVVLKNTEKDVIYTNSVEKHKDHNECKLIITLLNGRGYTERGEFRYLIDNGELSVGSRKNSAFLFYVKLNTILECEHLVQYLESKLVRYIIRKLDLIRLPYYDVLKFIKPINLSKSWTDEELYKYFNLTPEEIKLIEETVK